MTTEIPSSSDTPVTSAANQDNQDLATERKEANTCMAIGAGVGVLSAASAVLAGAVCPLCYVAVPGLIGYGAYRRWKCGGKPVESESKPQ